LPNEVDYNPEYTELLLNFYINKDQLGKIKKFLKIKQKSKAGQATEPIFDVDTAIEVCR